MLSYKQLKAFSAIAESGSMARASETLQLTQPALSSALSSLENELGIKLFDRINRRVILNKNGELVYPKILKILNETQQLKGIFLDKDDNLSGNVNIVASKTIGDYILPPLMASFKQINPNIQLNLKIFNNDSVINRIINHQSEIGFIERKCFDKNIESLCFIDDELVLFVKNNHPLSSLKNITIKDIKKYPFVIRENGSSNREVFEHSLLPILKYNINIFLELESSFAVLSAVKNSYAIGCISKKILSNTQGFKNLVIPGIKLKCPFFMLTNKNANPSVILTEWKKWINNVRFTH